MIVIGALLLLAAGVAYLVGRSQAATARAAAETYSSADLTKLASPAC
jgi:hypothetical protein